MRPQVPTTLAVVLVILTGVFAWQRLLLPEPLYQGKRLSDWLTAYRLHGVAGVESWQVRLEQQEADEAVRHVGTNALPTLLRMLRSQDSGLKARFAGLLARQQLIPVTYISAEEKHYRACWAFGVLRAKARTAVPALIKIASQNPSRDSGFYALAALGYIGPSAKEAIPFLLQQATAADASVGLSARNALTAIDPDVAAKAGLKQQQVGSNKPLRPASP